MKLFKNIILIAVASAGFTFAGCSDFLTVTPHDSLNSETAITSLSDCNATTRSVYESMRSTSYTSVFMLMVPDVMSDNLVLNQGGRLIYNELANFSFSSNTYGFQGMWSVGYNAVLSANEVITRLQSNESLMGEDTKLGNNLLAECLALRGLIHFDLVRCFGKNYLQASDSDLGAAYKFNTEIDFLSRNTVKEVYTWLLEDLKEAYGLMSDDYNVKANYRLSKKAIASVLARVSLTMGNYQDVVTYASAAITGDGSDISTLDDYAKVYQVSMDVPEVLFRIAIKAADGINAGFDWGQGPSVNQYQANYSVAFSFYELFQSTDVRKSLIAEVTQSEGQANVCWKWYNGGAGVGIIDVPMVRTPEMYLARAEAYYNLGGADNQAKALADLNIVRSHRYSDYEAGTETGSALSAAIQLQRRLELAFEGHRFFDLKRLNLPVQRDGLGYLIEGEGAPSDVQFVAADSPYYLMPIPQSEINANENMVQNNY